MTRLEPGIELNLTKVVMHAGPRTTARLIVFALLLAAGPLKATATFACEMMDTVVHDVCCCDVATEMRASGNQDCDGEHMGAVLPCCEHSATVGVDDDAVKATPASKQAGTALPLQPDPDQPDIGVVDTTTGIPLPPAGTVAGAGDHGVALPRNGSRLWLSTRRLRI